MKSLFESIFMPEKVRAFVDPDSSRPPGTDSATISDIFSRKMRVAGRKGRNQSSSSHKSRCRGNPPPPSPIDGGEIGLTDRLLVAPLPS